MVQKNEIYVSIDLDSYKENKANILASQVDLIGSIKHLSRLNELIQKEKSLKLRLHELFGSISDDLEKLEDALPTPSLPKSIQEKTHTNFEDEFLVSDKTESSIMNPEREPSPIDLELAEIQEKLRQLNAI